MAYSFTLTHSTNQKAKKILCLFWVHSILCVSTFLLSVCGFAWMGHNLEGGVWNEKNFHDQFGMLYTVCGMISPIAYMITAFVGFLLLKGFVSDIKRLDQEYGQLPYLRGKRRLISQLEMINRYMIVVVYTFFFGADLSKTAWAVAYALQVMLYLITIVWYIIAYSRLAGLLHTYYRTPMVPQFDDVERHVLE